MADLIDRQAAIEAMCGLMRSWFEDPKDEVREINRELGKLPPAQPERKKGTWLRDPPEGGYALYKCSVCGKCWSHWWASAMTVEEMTKEVRCCPHCGADMRG